MDVWDALPNEPPGVTLTELAHSTEMHVPRVRKYILALGDRVGVGGRGSTRNPKRYWRNAPSSPSENGYSPSVNDHHYTSEELADMWKLTWRHLVSGENIKNKDGTGLATDFNVSEPTAYRRIHFILENLPTVHRPSWAQPDMNWIYARGGKWLTERSEILMARARERGMLPEEPP